jgi:hypothetical protein
VTVGRELRRAKERNERGRLCLLVALWRQVLRAAGVAAWPPRPGLGRLRQSRRGPTCWRSRHRIDLGRSLKDLGFAYVRGIPASCCHGTFVVCILGARRIAPVVVLVFLVLALAFGGGPPRRRAGRGAAPFLVPNRVRGPPSPGQRGRAPAARRPDGNVCFLVAIMVFAADPRARASRSRGAAWGSARCCSTPPC